MNRCPECGCAEYEHEDELGPGYRVCSDCKQEWWEDIKYNEEEGKIPVSHFKTSPILCSSKWEELFDSIINGPYYWKAIIFNDIEQEKKMPVGHDVTWNEYYMSICDAVAKRSPCLSRKIGAIIIDSDDHSILSTGYNGPPAGFDHCLGDICPRHAKGYSSGEGLELCPAVHAEANAIALAASNGTCVYGATLVLNTVLPCKNCMGLIINAGIKEVIYKEMDQYDYLSIKMAKQCNIKLTHYLERSDG